MKHGEGQCITLPIKIINTPELGPSHEPFRVPEQWNPIQGNYEQVPVYQDEKKTSDYYEKVIKPKWDKWHGRVADLEKKLLTELEKNMQAMKLEEERKAEIDKQTKLEYERKEHAKKLELQQKLKLTATANQTIAVKSNSKAIADSKAITEAKEEEEKSDPGDIESFPKLELKQQEVDLQDLQQQYND